MSLAAYQRELSAMVADPQRRRAIAADPVRSLDGLGLDSRECERITAFSRDSGMLVNTALYRANRLSPIFNVLPLTSEALGEGFGPLVHRYWSERAIEDLQFVSEAARFAAYLHVSQAALLARTPGLAALLAYELASYELALMPKRAIRARVRPPRRYAMLHPLIRIVSFDVDASCLLHQLREDAVALARLPTRDCALLIDARAAQREELVISTEHACALRRFEERQPFRLAKAAGERVSQLLVEARDYATDGSWSGSFVRRPRRG